MPNKRKAGVARISVTLPEELLMEIEEAAGRRASHEPGFDRLAFIREAILEKVRCQLPKSENSEER